MRVALRAKTIIQPGEKVVGIDLGTTNSAVAALEAGKPTVIPNAEGERTTPSVVAFSKAGELLVGQIAKRQAVVNPENTFYSVKRFVGRQPEEVRSETREVSYRVETRGSQVWLDCPGQYRKLPPEEISAQVLRKLCKDAASYLSAEVNKAVVTVPAYFNDSQRQATKDAGTIAGLDVLRILNEPTAASLAYGLEKKTNETIMVFDLGGGTFDVSVLVVGDGVCEVLATCGDSHLGGDDFDKRIVDWLAEGFQQREGINLLEDRQALQRLTEAAEKAKIELSATQQATVSLPFIASDEAGPKHIEETLSRALFENLCTDLVDRCRGPVEQALEDSGLSPSELNEVVLVGGSTRIPSVQALAKKLAGGREPNRGVNPDEVVAIGAAVQAGVLTGEVRDLVLLDIIPLSLGVETHDGLSSVFMPRNTRIPMKKTKIYTTYRNNQDKVNVKVVQGERRFADKNKALGLFVLTGISPAPAGYPKIEVTFDVDSNGILTVSAQDMLTLQEQTVTITGSSTLAPEDVEKKVEEAKAMAAEEARLQRVTMVKNSAESIANALERVLRERRSKVKKSKTEMIMSKVLLIRQESVKDPLNEDLVRAVTEDLEEELKAIMLQKEREKYDVEQGFSVPEDNEPAAKEVARRSTPL